MWGFLTKLLRKMFGFVKNLGSLDHISSASTPIMIHKHEGKGKGGGS